MNQFVHKSNYKLAPVYVSKFNLQHQPFSHQFNSALFYENEGRKILLKKISHLLEFTKLILFVQGASGLGKTNLIQELLRQTKDNWRTCFINAKECTDPQKLITKISTDMSIKLGQTNHNSQTLPIQEQLDAMRQTGLTPILLIDDIENLNSALIPTLTSLIQHKTDTQPNIRLIVIGQDIPLILNQIIPTDKQESTLKYLPLPPLTEKESAAYIKHKLSVSGYQYTEPFNKSRIQNIYLDAKGFPIHLNQLADHILTQYTLDYKNQKPVINLNEKTNKMLKYIAGGLSALVTIFIIYTMFEKNPNQSTLTDSEIDKNILAIPSINKKIDMNPASPKKQVTSHQPITTNEKPKQLQKTTVNVAIKTEKNIETKKRTPVKKETKPKPTQASKDITWVNAQNPKYYTLQLIGSSSRAASKDFIKKHKLKKNTAIVRSLRKGKFWYSVIYQSFPTSKMAKSASKKLQPSLRRIKPWIRPFSAIQKSMK